jgi:thiosulfate/3-mercaptopyruvate sulfurtransferase
MSDSNPPLILDPEQLETVRGDNRLLLVDLCKESLYRQAHLPGAIYLNYSHIVTSCKPVHGLLPEISELTQLFSALGIDSETHVVAYDDEGGGKAGRLLWTLAVLGHHRCSLLDGGLHAWVNEGRRMEHRVTAVPAPATFTPHLDLELITDAAEILDNLQNPEQLLLDVRTPQEFSGEKKFSERGGHIPGAIHWEWTEALDPGRNLRLRPAEELRAALAARGVTPDQEVVVYCQTHHRSSHTFVVLRHLGFPRVKGYPGSWSDWGNRTDTPVA